MQHVVKKALLALVLMTMSGIPVRAAEPFLNLGSFKGQVVVVDFWASWCVPCRRSFPWLNEMQARYADQGLVVVGINVDTDRAEAEKFLKEFPARFDILYDATGRMPMEYGVTAMPTSLVFDREGSLVTRHLGFQNARRAEYENIIRDALAKARVRTP